MTFKGDSPLFPKLGGQASQQGGVKGREVELEISLLAIANYKNLLRITIWAEEFFHRGVDQNPLSAVRSPQSAVRSPQSAVRSPQSAVRSPQSAVHMLYTVLLDASYIM